MPVPLSMVFRNISKSEWLEDLIKQKSAKLERVCGDIVSCRVTIDLPHRRHRSGNTFQVRIDVRVPDQEIVVKTPADHPDFQDIAVAVQHAFHAVQRQLEDRAQEVRGEVKVHEERSDSLQSRNEFALADD